jgi:hypothetical protein
MQQQRGERSGYWASNGSQQIEKNQSSLLLIEPAEAEVSIPPLGPRDRLPRDLFAEVTALSSAAAGEAAGTNAPVAVEDNSTQRPSSQWRSFGVSKRHIALSSPLVIVDECVCAIEEVMRNQSW